MAVISQISEKGDVMARRALLVAGCLGLVPAVFHAYLGLVLYRLTGLAADH